MASGENPRPRKNPAKPGGRRGKKIPSQIEVPKGHLIVIARPQAKVRANRDGAPTAEAADVRRLSQAFAPPNVNLVGLFGRPENRLRRDAPPQFDSTDSDRPTSPDLSLFYRVDAPPEQLSDLAEQVRQNEAFEAAYIKPFTELPTFNVQAPAMEDPPSVTPDFTQHQGYLDRAPGGVDARYAWTIKGGNGTGVGIVDIEGAWRFSHEILNQLGGMVGGIQQTDISWRNHGTAVLGIMGAASSGFGITGICHGATIQAISHSGPGQTTATAIRQAADLLSPGDIILLEAHRPGPQAPTPFETNPQQLGFIAIEWWPDDFAAIDYAVRKGIIVVGAAGNGGVNLDDPIYDQNPLGVDSYGPFPSWWQNPFKRDRLNSGAILVGAGAPPSGETGLDRSRLSFSNFGLPVDAQGWGSGVTSAGYGDLQGGTFEDLWYTQSFSGTSSASPIVVGALACLQGAIKAAGGPLLTSPVARELLRGTGSDQTATPGQPDLRRIGKRPDLKAYLDFYKIGPTTSPGTAHGQADKYDKKSIDTAEAGSSSHVAVEPDLGSQPTPSNEVHHDNGVEGSVTDRMARIESRVDKLAKYIGVPI